MNFILVIIIGLLETPGTEEFSHMLAVRELTSAMELAHTDSLRAVVFERSGNHAMAAALYSMAFENGPSPGLFTRMWESVAASTEHFPELAAGGLRDRLGQWRGQLTFRADHLLSLIEVTFMLEDSTLADSLTGVLLDSFPDSEEAYQALGSEFYGSLYPVWNDEVAKLEVLQEFITRRGNDSDIWRSRAWRYTVSAVLATADSSSWRDSHRRWLDCCPNDPRPFLTGASLLIDRDSSFEEAMEMSAGGLEIMEAGYRPRGMPAEEWELIGPAMQAGLLFRKLQAMAALGEEEEALSDLNLLLDSLEFSVNDYNTGSALYWLRGTVKLDRGDTLAALSDFAESAVLGDVENTWSGRAVEAMEDILLPEVSPVSWAREHMEYSGPVFADVTPLLGPDSLLRGSRVSWCDWNGDGRPDLFAGSSLYQSLEGGGFRDVTAEAGLENCRGNGGVWGDLDRDGLPDLVTSGNPVQVFLSDDGGMVEATEHIGIERTGASVEGAALLDWNADGWLDLYLASYESPGEMGTGTADAFYLGSAGGFREAGDSLGMIPFLEEHLCGRGVSPCDFDRDGDMDIFVSNYRLQENLLWENVEGLAVNSALDLGLAGKRTEGWWGHTIGSAWGDPDSDGDWDLFSANLAHPRYITFSDRSMFYRNDGGDFTDIRAEAGIKFEETHSSPVWGDFNNDGLLDLFLTSVYPDRRSFLYLNSGDGTFRDVTWLSGARVFNGWGAAAADYNLDGRLDLAVGSGNGPVLLTNTTEEGYWLLVRVAPPEDCNPSGIGCTVVLEQGDTALMRQIEGGSGTTSQNSGILHFGLPGDGESTLYLYVPGSTEAAGRVRAAPGTMAVLQARQS